MPLCTCGYLCVSHAQVIECMSVFVCVRVCVLAYAIEGWLLSKANAQAPWVGMGAMHTRKAHTHTVRASAQALPPPFLKLHPAAQAARSAQTVWLAEYMTSTSQAAAGDMQVGLVHKEIHRRTPRHSERVNSTAADSGKLWCFH